MRQSRGSISTVLCFAVVLGGGCSSKSGANGGTPDAAGRIFPQAFRQTGFQMVRACRAPGEHSALSGFTVWVNDAAAAAYNDILQNRDAGAREMPNGAIVVKELYRDRICTVVDRWVAMKKITGFDPSHGDWFWQDVAATGAVTIEGQAPSCSGCHEGRPDATCIGYGAVNGMDYLCRGAASETSRACARRPRRPR